MNPDTPCLLAQHSFTYHHPYGAPGAGGRELAESVAGPYELPATFAVVMLLSALVLVVFMKPGGMARIIASVPFSLFILSIVAIPLQAATGFILLDFAMSETPSPVSSTLRLAAELLCYLAAWKCIPWLYLAKEAFIRFIVRLLTRPRR